MANDLFGVRWTNPESSGYDDIFAFQDFKVERIVEDFRHAVRGPKDILYWARCRLTVKGTRADFDYRAFPVFNTAKDWYLGIMRFHFRDSSRSEVRSIEWSDSDYSALASATAHIIKVLAPKQTPYMPKKGKASKRRNAIAERPGQVRFREILLGAYGYQCCITGCPVPEALEGAHIDPFSGAHSDHPQNGLLLRQDLHRLFDTGLLAFEPKTLQVFFAPSALECPEYKSLHGKARLRLPSAASRAFPPSKPALSRRWARFKKRYP